LANQDYSKEAQLLLPRQNFGFQRAASRYEAPGGGTAGVPGRPRPAGPRAGDPAETPERPNRWPDGGRAVFGHDLQT
jgi:hypothetical protein